MRLLLSFPGNRYKLKAFLENKPTDVSAYIDNFVKMIDKEAYTDIQVAWRNEGWTTKTAEYHIKFLLESLFELQRLVDRRNIFISIWIASDSYQGSEIIGWRKIYLISLSFSKEKKKKKTILNSFSLKRNVKVWLTKVYMLFVRFLLWSSEQYQLMQYVQHIHIYFYIGAATKLPGGYTPLTLSPSWPSVLDYKV